MRNAITRLAAGVTFGLGLLGAGTANVQSMTLTSTDIKEGGTLASEQVFKGFGCTGSNLSPALNEVTPEACISARVSFCG